MKLIDVYPDEVAEQPALGGYQLMVSRISFAAAIARGFTDAQTHPAKHAPCSTGSSAHANHVFLPGHRIMVQVQSAWFPLYDRNPQTFVPNIMFAKPGDYQKAEQRIYHTPDNASYIELPLVKEK